MPPGPRRTEERPRRDRPEEAGTEHADQIKTYRDQQAKIAAKETADTTAPAARKRTKAEAVVNSMAMMVSKIGDLEFPDFSADDRTMLIETMTSLKETLESAITRAAKNKKNLA